jgi:hypothetical protein
VGESELIVEFFLVHDLSISYLRELYMVYSSGMSPDECAY